MSLAAMASSRAHLAEDPETALMLRVKRDEPGAFAELERRCRHKIFGRFFRWLGDRQEAEDLAQDVFLRVYRSRRRYRPTARFGTWLFHITQNVARNALRARKRRLSRSLETLDGGREELFCQVRGEAAPLRHLESVELADVVRAAVADLGDRQRLALEMQQFQHRSCAEVAAALHVTPRAAKSLLYRARVQLRVGLLKRQVW
jgi:RNA polymerase sigma-70 factor (ECF subfamily)